MTSKKTKKKKEELRNNCSKVVKQRQRGALILPVFTESVVIHALGLHVRVQVLFFFHWGEKNKHSRRDVWVIPVETPLPSPEFAPKRMTAAPPPLVAANLISSNKEGEKTSPSFEVVSHFASKRDVLKSLTINFPRQPVVELVCSANLDGRGRG